MEKTLKVTQLRVYPIKSLPGISLDSVNVLPKGFEFDRRFMLVDENGIAITQRTHPVMSLFNVAMGNNELLVRMTNESVTIPLSPSTGTEFTATIWNDTVTTIEPDAHLSEWFSNHAGVRCKLVFFPEGNPRRVDPRYDTNENHVSLADAYPVLVVGQASLDELNRRLDTQVSMTRFRPNIVFSGGEPFEEDNWGDFRIGQGTFKAVKPCDRCVLINVNPESGEKGSEPLRTLTTFRKQGNKVLFGQNVLVVSASKINVGDEISIESYR